MESYQTFEHEEFGKLHVLDSKGELWFIGNEIARALKYKDPRAAVRDHVDDEDKRAGQNAPTFGGAQNVTLINESGFYSLVLSSKLPAAKRFKRWVTSEVIPSIRKTGSYFLTKSAILPAPSSAPVEAIPAPVPAKKVRRPLSPMACTYALLMSNNTVKIGHSDNVNERKVNLKSKYKLTRNLRHERYEVAQFFP